MRNYQNKAEIDNLAGIINTIDMARRVTRFITEENIK